MNETPTNPKPKWFQIRIRTLLFLAILFLAAIGLVVIPLIDNYFAKQWVKKNGGMLIVDGGRAWLYDNVTGVTFRDGVELTDLRPLTSFPDLKILEIKNAKVSDYSALAKMKKLTYLDLRGSNISDLSPVAGLWRLRYLDISDSDVEDLTSFKDFEGRGSDQIYSESITLYASESQMDSCETDCPRLNFSDMNSQIPNRQRKQWLVYIPTKFNR